MSLGSSPPNKPKQLSFFGSPDAPEDSSLAFHPFDTSAVFTTPSEQNNEHIDFSRPYSPKTSWHPLFASALSLYLPPGFHIITEKQLTQEPQRVDVVIWDGPEQFGGPYHGLSAIMSRLTKHNLFEFKSPLDPLAHEDFSKLVGYGAQYHSIHRSFDLRELSLFTVASRWTSSFEAGVLQWGFTPVKVEPGIYQITGSPWQSWCIETEIAWELPHNEALGLFSQLFLKDPRAYIQQTSLPKWIPIWVAQQCAAYRKRSDHMPLLHQEQFDKMLQEALSSYFEDLTPEEILKAVPLDKILQGIPPEERLKGVSPEEVLKAVPFEEVLKAVPFEERLKGVSPEERLKGVSPEERLKGVSPEERLKGLSAEELEQLKKLLS